jgi:hypothetical protein
MKTPSRFTPNQSVSIDFEGRASGSFSAGGSAGFFSGPAAGTLTVTTKLAGFPVEAYTVGQRFTVGSRALHSIKDDVARAIGVSSGEISVSAERVKPNFRKASWFNGGGGMQEYGTPLKLEITYTPRGGLEDKATKAAQERLKALASDARTLGVLRDTARNDIEGSVRDFARRNPPGSSHGR